MHRPELKLYFDGGCQPNPGEMEVAVVARGVTHYRPRLGHGTNNEAEWIALLYALEIAKQLGKTDIVMIGDSDLVINQAKGLWKCRSPDLRAHLSAFNLLSPNFRHIRLRSVRRSQNLAGIALAKQHAGL